ncbi:Nonaspanin TM9SF [Lactarius vividus]|nr:Nonaspanin TM9SF [Lactarius vividus]
MTSASRPLVGLVLAALVTSLVHVHAFYLPGAAPHDYRKGEKVDIFVNALTPMYPDPNDPKLRSLINYDYYHPQFHFCEPDGGPRKQPESLGSILFGDRIFDSPYDIQMLQPEDNTTCKSLCISTVPPEDAKFINHRIREDYALNWLVDGLPAAEEMIEVKSGELFFNMGFRLGRNEGLNKEHPQLNNHYDIDLRYHSLGPRQNRIVGVLVWPSSRGGSQDGPLDCKPGVPPLILSETEGNRVRYTYRVRWGESSTPWASRWDNYLHIFDRRMHLFSLINSLVIVVFLCAMVSTIVYRSVSRDISRFNAIDLGEDVQEDWGWKLVHGEVFRTPNNPLILSTFVGNGAQLCITVGFTLVLALLGFLSPSNRGSFTTVMMICWTFFGSVGGYVSSRIYASLGGTERTKNAFVTATAFPAIIFMIMFLINLFLITANSSGAVPFGTMLIIVLLWFGISAPLSAIGAYFGARRGAISHPVCVNPIPRQIPPPPRYLRPWATTLLGGILPFGASLVELHFVLSSLLTSRAYYAYGFLALAVGVVGLTTATTTILFTYYVLCAEEYRWHWRAFLTGGGNAIWLLAYGLFYLVSRLSLGSSSVAIYFGYLFLFAILDFLVTGTIGFLATYWAIRKLYGSVRVD